MTEDTHTQANAEQVRLLREALAPDAASQPSAPFLAKGEERHGREGKALPVDPDRP